MLESSNIIGALDVGTTKVTCVIASPDEDGGVNVVGIGNATCRGMARGMVINVDRTVASIRQAVGEAEHMAGVKLKSVMLGVAGGKVQCYNAKGIAGVRDSRKRIITEDDKRRALENAISGDIPSDRELIHTIEQEYTVDNQTNIKDPLGMMGLRLEVNVHIITVSLNALQNIMNCARQADLEIMDDDDVVLESLASAKSCLRPEETQMGVAIVDIGGGSVDLAIFENSCVRHTKVFEMGGDNLTRDISLGFQTPMDAAELLKVEEGCCLRTLLGDEEFIIVPGTAGKNVEVSRHVLCDVLVERVEEILGCVNHELVVSGYYDKVMEVVLTGGGSLLLGLPEVAEQVFDRPVRLGEPTGVGGLTKLIKSPRYSTAMGLILYGMENYLARDQGPILKNGKGFFSGVKEWFSRSLG
ncbi:MAG: cell division protein FtsA [Deltaproteobacteria bacterium]|jgi:cell division protein FtsA|nr:cell division protein FtsA [Deltaproteobacteria bacterium]